ncbi:MAG: hypothetical protein ABIS07_13665 [Dokdonella sp.]
MKILYKWMVAALVVAAAQPAVAANLIVNANFDTDVGSWTADTGTVIGRDPNQDANAAPTSGSMALTTSNGSNSNLSAHQCIAGPSGGSDFSFGAKIKPNSASQFGMTCTAYASADCLGDPIGSASAILAGPADGNGWVPLHTESPYTLPASTLGVSCAITTSQPLRAAGAAPQPNGFTNAIWADNVFFGPGTTPVSLQGFDVD